MKKKLSLFMIATVAVAGLSLATLGSHQTVSANDASYSNDFYGHNGPDSWLLYTVW
ncbi:TPA: SpoV family signaling peptide [Streptococcus pyogenes]